MAFCFRSERKMEFQTGEDKFTPGPGQYLDTTSKIDFINKVHPPFQTSAKRDMNFKNTDTPGPGSYDLDRNNTFGYLNIKKYKKIIDNDNNEIKTINNDKNSNNSSLININNVSNINIKNTHFTNSSMIPDNSFNKYNNNSINYTANKKNESILKTKNSSTVFNKNDVSESNVTTIFGCNVLNHSLNSEKFGFLSQTSRFIEQNDFNKINCPGPGTYELNKERNIYNKISNKNNKLKSSSIKINKTGSLNRIISIPSKIMNGYIYEDEINKSLINGKNNKNLKKPTAKLNEDYITNRNKKMQLIMNPNITNEKNKNSTTSEFIGPGTYDIFIKQKGNGVMSWIKSSNPTLIKQKEEAMKQMEIIDEIKKIGDISTACSNDEEKKIPFLYRNFGNTIDNSKKMENIKNYIKMTKNNIINSRCDFYLPDKKDIPGPGYYSKEITKLKEQLKINENNDNNKNNEIKKLPELNYRKFQIGSKEKIENCFGSSRDRFISNSKSMKDLGPTTYFLSRNKYTPDTKPHFFNQLKLGKTLISDGFDINFDTIYYPKGIPPELQKNNSVPLFKTKNKKSEFKIPGPGTYELSHTFIKHSTSNIQLMQNNIERFIEKFNENPGPGTYYENILNNSCDNIKKVASSSKKNKNSVEKDFELYRKMQKIERIRRLNKKRNEIPGVGSYNPGFSETIDYKMRSKYNPKQSYQSPFMYSSGRFNYAKDDSVSPAIYDPKKIDKKNFVSFSKAERFGQNEFDHNGIWHLAGPGSYDLNKDEWNKKSFNSLFAGINKNNEE